MAAPRSMAPHLGDRRHNNPRHSGPNIEALPVVSGGQDVTGWMNARFKDFRQMARPGAAPGRFGFRPIDSVRAAELRIALAALQADRRSRVSRASPVPDATQAFAAIRALAAS